MNTHRRRSEPRREILSADLDRFASTRAPWIDDGGEVACDALRDAVRAAVASVLTNKQREVVEAHFFEGQSQSEIALRLGITQQVVQKRIYGTLRGERMVGGAFRRLRAALRDVHAAGVRAHHHPERRSVSPQPNSE